MTQPPQRRRLRKRWVFLIFLLAVVFLLVGVHVIWTIGARRALDKQVAAYRTAGEPIEPGDFTASGLAPETNAVPELRAAAAAIDRTTTAWEIFKGERDGYALALRRDEEETLRALLAENPKVLPLVTSASKKTGVDWGLVFTTPALDTTLPDLRPQRDLAQFLKGDALLAHTDGDHARAVQRTGEILFLGRAVGRQPILVSHLVSIGMSRMASDVAIQLAGDLRLGDEPGAVAPQQIRDLIAQLLDEDPLAHSRRGALLGERMMQLDMARAVADGRVTLAGKQRSSGTAFIAAVMKPTALGDALIMIRHTSGVLEAAESAATSPAYKRAAPVYPPDVHGQNWRHVVGIIFMPSLDRAMETHYRALVDRRLAAVMLALRLYASEHDGRLPESLNEIVPAYLPAVPSDALAPTTQPLKYVAGADPIVYSVGPNATDDGGSELRATKRSPPGEWDRLDRVAHFKRQPRPPQEWDDGVGEYSTRPATTPSTAPASLLDSR